MKCVSMVVALSALGACGGTSQPAGKGTCSGTVSGDAAGSFSRCDSDGEGVVNSGLSITANGLSPMLSTVGIFFVLVPDPPTARTYLLSDFSLVALDVETVGGSNFVLRHNVPAQLDDQGDATLTFTSVTKAAPGYAVHGSFDAMLPSDVGTPAGAVELRVAF